MIMDLIYQKLGKLNSMMKCRSFLSLLVVFFVSFSSLKAQSVPFTTCSGTAFNFSNEPGYVSGEIYTWTVASSTGTISGQANGTGTTISQTLTNALGSSGSVTYNVTSDLNTPFTLIVTVNPKATITNTGSFVTPICSGISQNFTATTSVPGTNVVWTRGAIIGISNPGNTGNFINEALVNTTTSPITVPYTFTLTTVSTCVSTTTINAVVNPIPSMNNSLALPAICNGDPFTFSPTSTTPGATYSWTRAPIANNLLAAGTGNVNEILFNNTNAGILVQYVYTTSISGQCPNNEIVTVPVNPIPNIADQTITPICGNGSFILNPAGAPTGTQYTWSIPAFTPAITGATAGIASNSISQSLLNSSPSTNATGIYVVTPKTGSCIGAAFNVNVTVNAGGLGLIIPNETVLECNNTPFTIPLTNGPAGTTYTWGSPSGTLIGGTAQSNPSIAISGTLFNNSNAPATATYDVVPELNGCTGSIFQVAVTVDNPAILSGSLTPPAVCSGTPFIYHAASTSLSIFTWVRNAVPGITNTPATNVGDINEILINTSSLPVTVNYIYTLQTGNCTNQQIVSVIVNPIPVLNSATPNPICSGALFNYTPTSATAGTAYQWNRPFVTSISNISASGINNPGEVLVNTSINSVLVGYNYTLIANGCNNNQTVNVIVKPIPIITNQIASICSGAQFSITPSPVPSGTQYTWTNPTINPTNSILDGLPQGSPQTTISATLNNFTPNPASAKYIITPTVNGCTGSTFSLDVTVTAITTLTSSLTPPTICSGQPFNYAPTSNTLGTIIGWARGPVAGILEAAASGIGNPLEVLTNNSIGIVTVPYLFTLTTPTGCVSTQIVNAKVYPAPVLSSQLVEPPICTGTIFNYTPLSTSIGAIFSWNRPAIPGMSNAPGSGTGLNYPLEQLDNISTTPKTVSYNFTINVNGCTNTQTVTVIVNPKPVVPNQTALTCSNVLFSVTPTGVIAGTQYTWSLPTSNSGSISGGFAQPILQDSISQLLGNTTINNAIATYTVTPYAYGCQGSDFTLNVTVRPEPIVANQIIAAVCSNTAFSYAAGAVPVGTTYTWSNPLVAPTNSLSGGSAQAFNQNLVSQTLTSTNNQLNTAVYTVTPSSGGCVGATFTLTVPVKPVPIINNLFDTICSGTAFSVSPSPVPLNTTYTWSLPTSIPFGRIVGGSGNNVPVNAISQTPVNTGGTPAQLLYTVTPITNGCTGSPFTLLETVGVQLPVIANTAATVCSSVPFNATPTGLPVNTKYTWAVQSITPAGTLAGTRAQTIAQTTVSDTIANISSALATAVYAVTPSNTGCVGNVFLATINVRPIPKATITAPATVCAYINDTLSVSFAGTGPWSFNYLDNGVAKTQTGITSNPYTWIVPTPLLATSKSLIITRVNDFACVDSISNTTINQLLNPLPLGHIINLHGQYICNNTLDTLFIGHTLDTLSFQWTLNGVPMPNLTTDSISTLIPGRYNAYFTNKYGCTDTAAVAETLTYISQPVVKFSYDNYCIDNIINFKNLTDTTYTGPTSWLWDLGDSTTRTRFDAATTYPTAGHRKIVLRAFQFFCPAYTTTLDSVINIEFPTPGIRMPSVSAYSGQNTPIIGRTLPNYTYNWSPAWGIDHPDSASVYFNYQKTQEYLFQLIAPSGCITSDTVLVRVFDNNLVNILVPKSFTPNGDGVNDKLFPYLTGIKTFQYYKVYNRFGKLMFETRNYDEGWDGSVGGTPQPMAIYIWVAAGIGTDGTLVEKRGETLLLR
jgi:gliding motility-associated-like protein